MIRHGSLKIEKVILDWRAIMSTKKCTKCGVEKELSEFNKSSRNKSGVRAECQKCQREHGRNFRLLNYEKELERCRKKDKTYIANGKRKEWTKAWRKTEKGKAWLKEYVERYRERKNELAKIRMKPKRQTPEYKAKHNCRSLTRYAIKTKTLVRQPCEVCGAPRAQAHHEDYSKPLEVRWFCQKHHAELHKTLIQGD
jgi:hypothetical protein